MREADLARAARRSSPSPTPMLAVVHSPTPSTVRIAASSKGDAKKRARRVRDVVLDEQELRPSGCRAARACAS